MPSIFTYPVHLQKRAPVPRRSITRHITPQPEASTSSAPGTEDSSSLSTSVNAEHSYALNLSPRGVKRRYCEMLAGQKQRSSYVVRKLRQVRRKLLRRQRKLQDMKDTIKQLKSRTDINEAAVNVIEQCFGSIPAEMLNRKLRGNSKHPYNDTIRSFAMTLHFYSPKAYSFVRSSFRSALPYPSTLRKWSTSVDGRPGFTAEAFEVSLTLFC